MMNATTQPTELHLFLKQLVSPLQKAPRPQGEFARVEAYWHLGRIIIEVEQQGEIRAQYGTQLIEAIARELVLAFGKGYTANQLWYFRRFYIAFPILRTSCVEFISLRDHLRQEITWSHYRKLMTIDQEQRRQFYLHQAAEEHWSVRTLNQLINSRYYEQVVMGEEQLLATESDRLPPLTGPVLNRRSRIAYLRQWLMNQPGWALVERRSCGLAMTITKPAILFYQIALQRYIGVWLGEPDPARVEAIRQQLTGWPTGPSASQAPVALLVGGKGMIKRIISPKTASLQPAESALIPERIEGMP